MTMLGFFVGVMRIDRIKSETINPEARVLWTCIEEGQGIYGQRMLRIELPGSRPGCREDMKLVCTFNCGFNAQILNILHCRYVCIPLCQFQTKGMCL